MDRVNGGAARVRLAYILAASHSGSTLLALLLARHPEVCTAGELKLSRLGDPHRYRCSCGAPILECPFWRAVTERMAQAGFRFTSLSPGMDFAAGGGACARRLLRPLCRGPILERVRDAALALSPRFRAWLPEAQARNAALARAILGLTGKRVIVDSSKSGVRLKYLLRNPALDVRVIRLIRDGRAVSLACMDPGSFADARDPERRAGGFRADKEAARRLSAAAAAHAWRRSNEAADAIVRGLPDERVAFVRYEDLCGDPAATLDRLFAFLGVDRDAPLATPRAARLHVVGNGMRLDGPVPVRCDERWRAVLGPRDLAVFEAEAGARNRSYGYP